MILLQQHLQSCSACVMQSENSPVCTSLRGWLSYVKDQTTLFDKENLQTPASKPKIPQWPQLRRRVERKGRVLNEGPLWLWGGRADFKVCVAGSGTSRLGAGEPPPPRPTGHCFTNPVCWKLVGKDWLTFYQQDGRCLYLIWNNLIYLVSYVTLWFFSFLVFFTNPLLFCRS